MTGASIHIFPALIWQSWEHLPAFWPACWLLCKNENAGLPRRGDRPDESHAASGNACDRRPPNARTGVRPRSRGL